MATIMQNTAFDTDDVVRILQALFPDPKNEDPFGRLEESILRLQKLVQEEAEEADAYREIVLTDLEKISARTFGIFILQMIKVLKTIIGFFPPGRVILIVGLAVGLIVNWLEDGELSGEQIRSAVAESGLLEFLSEQLRKLQAVADKAASNVEVVTEGATDILRGLEFRAEALLTELNYLVDDLAERGAEAVDDTQLRLDSTIRDLLDESFNLATNAVNLVGPALENVPGQIRSLPAEARALIE